MRVVSTDAKYHLAKTPEKCLPEAEQVKKKIYLESCLQIRQHLSPFVAYVDGILGVEASAILKRLAIRLATNWRQPYSRMCVYVKSRITIALVRATHRCIWSSRVLAHKISAQRLQWYDGAGLNLFR